MNIIKDGIYHRSTMESSFAPKLNPILITVAGMLLTTMVICSGCARKPISSTFSTTSIATSPSTISTTAISSTTTGSTPASSTPISSTIYQQYTNLAVKFHALLTFSLNNTNVSYPTDLAVPQVPVIWSGTSFSGTLHESGPGEDITDRVAGTISADGNVLVSLAYSRQVLRTTNSGTAFSVSLASVPLDIGASPGTYVYSGASIQGYVSGINYADGTIVSGQIVASTIYVSTDWGNIQQPPTLTIIFGK